MKLDDEFDFELRTQFLWIDSGAAERQIFQNDRHKTAEKKLNARMDIEGNFKEYDCAAKVAGINLTEPNQALQRMRELSPLVESRDSGPHR